MDNIKTYSELITLQSYDERLKYLMTHKDNPSNKNRRLLNKFYKSNEWEAIRKKVIERDLSNDLGIIGLEIKGIKLVHHIEPITEEDVRVFSPKLLDMNNLICVSYETHNTIHYLNHKEEMPTVRTEGDTKLW